MPELPEVETVKRGLNKLIINKRIISVSDDNYKSFPNDKQLVEQFLIGSSVIKIRRRGKALMIDLNNKYCLVVHLKMTGQLVYVDSNSRWGAGHPNDSFVAKLPDKSTRVEITFNDKSKLFFNDQRKFGWMRLLPTSEVENLPFFQKLGPEPLVDSFTADEFKSRVRRRKNTNIKAAILDQSTLAGVGNIYADESLFGAKIHPQSLVKDISDDSLESLLKEIKSVMNLSIEKGGSTDKNYVNAEGGRGSYLEFAKVFRRENQPCLIDGSPIVKIRVAGRGTHFCPLCQVKAVSKSK